MSHRAPSSPRRPRTVAALTAAVLAATLAGCGVAGDEESQTGSQVGVNDTDGAGSDGSEGSEKDGSAGSSSEGGGSASGGGKGGDAKAGGTSSGAAATKAELNGSPAEGRYTYDMIPVGGNPSTWHYDVVDAGDRKKTNRQFLTWSTGDDATRYLGAWTKKGLYIEAEQRARGAQTAPSCGWEPIYLENPITYTAGQKWTIDTSCKLEGGATKRRTGSAEVTGKETVRVGDRDVEVMVIRKKLNTVSAAEGLQLGEEDTLTDRYAWGLGLLISREATSSTTINGASKPGTTYTMTVRSLKPGKVPYKE